MTSAGELWVFGYGSLMWNPGFEVAEQTLAVLQGFRRSFCMWSIHHRGTKEEPGLVLALDPAPECRCTGLALRVKPGLEETTLAYLRERELISAAYLEEFCTLALADGRTVRAVTYVVDTDHAQYCRALSLERQAEVIARAIGGRGPNAEYLYNTAQHMSELNIEDPDMDWLVNRVRDISATPP